jgi:ABC-type transport system involved in cytochrome c biogenesis permease subunit
MQKNVSLLIVLCCLFTFAAGQQNSAPAQDSSALSSVAWDKLASLPVLHEGRIKPVDSLARFCLLQISGRSSVKTERGTLSALVWLGHVIFQDEETKKWPVFLVENPEILQGLGIPYSKDRDRYPYQTLEPKLEKLMQQASQAAKKDKNQRTLIHNQQLRLAENIQSFHILWHTFNFMQKSPKPTHPEAAKILGDNATLADYFLLFAKLQVDLEHLSHTDASSDATRQPRMEKLMETLLAMQQDLAPLYGERYSNFFTILPPASADPADKQWFSPWDVLLSQIKNDDRYKRLWKPLCEMPIAFQQKAWPKLNENLAALHAEITAAATARGEYRAILLEVQYNRYDMFFYSLLLCLLSLLACALSWLGLGEKKWYWLSLALLIIGYLACTYGLTLRVLIKQRPPVSNLYESVLFVGWGCITLAFFIEAFFRHTMRSFGLFLGNAVGTILLFVASKYAQDGDNLGVLVAVLDSNFWLATHVTTIAIGYSACLLAGGIGHVLVLLPLCKRNLSERFYQDMERMMYGTVCFALLFAFIGTVLGGLWADQSWGRFWGWDPKENGALLIVLWYAAMIHAHVARHIGVWGLALGTIFGNIIVAAAWWGVNLLNIGLHNYGFTSGLFTKLVIFTVVEIGFILAGSVAKKLVTTKLPTSTAGA